MTKPARHGPPYLLLKCRAEQIGLRDGSVDLVIVTPPYYGAPGVSRKDCCPLNPGLYGTFLARCLGEAKRVVKPGGYILMHTRKLPLKRVKGVLRIVFQVLKKSARGSRQTVTWVRAEKFRARFVRVKGITWYGFPVWLYQSLIDRYSHPGARLAHTFSGTGNSAIAALRLSRLPILLDLHHHRQVQRRLNKLLRRHRGKRCCEKGQAA